MKKYLFSILLLATCCGLAKAQENLVLRVGAGVSGLHSAHVKNLGAFMVGVGYEHEFNQKWSVLPMLLYYARGWKERDVTVPARDDNGNFVYDEKTGEQVFGKKGQKSHANYLQVPVLVNYYIHLVSPHYISLSAGPYFAYGISGDTEIYGDTERQGAERVYYEQDTFDEYDARRFDMGLTFGVGYDYNRHINLAVNTDIGLLRVRPNGGKTKNFYLTFNYRF